MGEYRDLLKELGFYLVNESGLEDKKNKNRDQYNLKKILTELEVKKKDPEVKQRYDKNIQKAKEIVKTFDIVHTTNLNCLISIIQNGAILSITDMEKKDISFNYLISFRGINEEMFNYVSASVDESDAIYGQYEIRFKKQIEGIPNSKFLPMNHLEYSEEVIKDYLCDIKYWRAYLAEYIAVNYESPENYIKETYEYLRPQLLFSSQIPLSLIESVSCINKKAYNELVSKIKSEFGENNDILNIIKVASA